MASCPGASLTGTESCVFDEFSRVQVVRGGNDGKKEERRAHEQAGAAYGYATLIALRSRMSHPLAKGHREDQAPKEIEREFHGQILTPDSKASHAGKSDDDHTDRLIGAYRTPFDLIFERAKSENWSALADDFRTFLQDAPTVLNYRFSNLAPY